MKEQSIWDALGANEERGRMQDQWREDLKAQVAQNRVHAQKDRNRRKMLDDQAEKKYLKELR